jgi:hypothetical protein
MNRYLEACNFDFDFGDSQDKAFVRAFYVEKGELPCFWFKCNNCGKIIIPTWPFSTKVDGKWRCSRCNLLWKLEDGYISLSTNKNINMKNQLYNYELSQGFLKKAKEILKEELPIDIKAEKLRLSAEIFGAKQK